MVRVVMALTCGAALAGGAYWGGGGRDYFANREMCGALVPVMSAPASGPGTSTAPTTGMPSSKNSSVEVVDIGNKKCIVSGDDVGSQTVEYQGKLYHLCCTDCRADFKKDPAKYVKALESDPAKYGVKK
jgi:YHS domain-containing protein